MFVVRVPVLSEQMTGKGRVDTLSPYRTEKATTVKCSFPKLKGGETK